MNANLGARRLRPGSAARGFAWLAGFAMAAAASAAWAQPDSAVPPAPAASATPEVRVIEDQRVRIEETRVRGQLQRITVAPKGPAGQALRPYEINVGSGGRDPSQDKSAAGQRVWSVLRF